MGNNALQPKWTKVVAALAAPNAAPTLASHGIAVTAGRRGTPLHIGAKKTSTATVVAYGYATATATWFALETWTWAGDSLSHGEPMEFASAYDRIAFHVSARGGGTITIWIGEADEEAY